MLRILLDTNILIPSEDTTIPVPPEVADLIRIGTINCTLLVHPAILDDLSKDRDHTRREIVLSKIRKYQALEDPPLASEEFLSDLGVKYIQPTVDDHLLYALKRNCVHLLVTEDKGIHSKARRLNLDTSVYNIKDCLELFQSLFGEVLEAPSPFIDDVPLYQLKIEDPIFDSLRNDYPGFNQWFAEKCKEGRKAWIVRAGGVIQGVCIYKEEMGSEEGLCSGLVLKMCTFKIREESRGAKIGELLLKAAFQYSKDHSYEGIYFTAFPDKEDLINFCSDFGFEERKIKKGYTGLDAEHIFYKSFSASQADGSEDALLYCVKYWPYLLGGHTVRKFIVPVKPDYHQVLFPEIQERVQRQLWQPNIAVSNAIRKAYICRAKLREIFPGDLLLFYRTHDLMAITTLGIVEQAQWVHEAEKIVSMAGKRTVFSVDDIQENFSNGALVILFREIEHLSRFPRPSEYDLPYPQRIQRIPHDAFCNIMDLRRNKECLME